MTTQSRHYGRRSLSIFSLEHFRSRSRGEAHAVQPDESRGSLRSPSSPLCNPHAQLQLASQPNTAVSNVEAQEHLRNTTSTTYHRETAPTPFQDQVHQSSSQKKARPRSWLFFPRPSLRRRHLLGRSLSVQLPKEASSSTVARSIISAPILTGTTNIDVAESEGVCCRDIVDVGLTSCTEYSRESSKRGPKHVFHNIHLGRLRLFRVVDIRKDKKEKTTSFLFESTSRHNLPPESEESWRFSAVERGISRRRAETINLCRKKINKITGHGNIKRKSINHNTKKTLSADRAGDDLNRDNDDIIVDPHVFSRLDVEEGQFLTLKHNSLDHPVESLSKSFASAIDKLEFRSTSVDNMGFVKVKQSILNLRKRNKQGGSTSLEKSSRGQEKVNVTQQSDMNAREDDHDHQQNEAGSSARPLQFSAEKNGYVPSESVASYPKGVKVLGMHSNTMEFATAPSWVTDLPKPVPLPPTVNKITSIDDDNEEQVIEDAPIYSPSLGDLSQYARATPQSAQPAISSRQRPEPDTPTRTPMEKGRPRRLGLGRSKSGLGLLGLFGKGQKDEADDIGPIHTKDENQRLSKMQQLRKSRSMNLPALLRKGDACSATEPLLKQQMDVPTQPIKPSPLRFETKAEDNMIKYPSATFADHKRTPPRGSITPSDRAKRMGIVGMPRESFEKHVEED